MKNYMIKFGLDQHNKTNQTKRKSHSNMALFFVCNLAPIRALIVFLANLIGSISFLAPNSSILSFLLVVACDSTLIFRH
jgi:hypothetical protein